MSIAKSPNYMETSSEFTFVWKIEGISHCLIKKGDKLDSPSFKVQNKGQWHLVFYPHGYLSISAECSLRNNDSFRYRGKLSSRFCVSDSKQKLLYCEDRILDFEENIYNVLGRFKREIFEELHDDVLFLHCHMWKSTLINVEIENPVHNIAETRIIPHRSIFHWKIKNFSTLQFGEERILSSLKFPSIKNHSNSLSMTMKLFLSGKNLNDALVQLRLYFEGLQESTCQKATCSMSVLEGNKSMKHVKGEYWLGSVLNVVKIELSKRRDLLARNLPDDTLTLQGEVHFTETSSPEFNRYLAYDESDDERFDEQRRQVIVVTNFCSVYGLPTNEAIKAADTHFVPVVSDPLLSFPPPAGLSDDMLQLFSGNGPPSDFELLVEGRSFPVHQLLLASRSSVFQAMLASDMLETNKRSLELTDIDVGTAERLLRYVYMDEEPPSDLSLELLIDLYSSAEKYALSGLKRICGKRLVQELDLTCAPRVLQISDRHNDPFLKFEVLDFFMSQGCVAIESENWKKLEQDDPKLANEVLHKIIHSNNQIITKNTTEVKADPKKRLRRSTRANN